MLAYIQTTRRRKKQVTRIEKHTRCRLPTVQSADSAIHHATCSCYMLVHIITTHNVGLVKNTPICANSQAGWASYKYYSPVINNCTQSMTARLCLKPTQNASTRNADQDKCIGDDTKPPLTEAQTP